MIITPAILESDLHALQRAIATLGSLPLVDLLHIDIMDGRFVSARSDFSAEEFFDVSSAADLEIHLMVCDPAYHLSEWYAHPCVRRVIVHVETCDALANVLEISKTYHKALTLALNPQTPAAKLAPHASLFDSALLLGVEPGRQGQSFDQGVIEKARDIHKQYPHLSLTVDGGVNEQNIVAIHGSGCDRVVVGSYLFDGTSPVEQLRKLHDICA